MQYDILFKAGSETLFELGRDPKHLGAEIGVIAVLHTTKIRAKMYATASNFSQIFLLKPNQDLAS